VGGGPFAESPAARRVAVPSGLGLFQAVSVRNKTEKFSVETGKARKKKHKIEPFFGPSEPQHPCVRDQHAPQWKAVVEHFIAPADRSRFNIKVGHRSGWDHQKRSGSTKVRPVPRPLYNYNAPLEGAYVVELERHLDLAAANVQARRRCSSRGRRDDWLWLGTYGGEATWHTIVDVDNHDKKNGLGFHDHLGRYKTVASLSLGYLKTLARLWSKLPILPSVVYTSSRSLGLGLLYHLHDDGVRRTVPTHLAYVNVVGMLAGIGLTGIEVYPMPLPGRHPQGNKPNPHRLPFGYGSVTITQGRVINPWWEQVDNYIDPAPEPDIRCLCLRLIEMWKAQHEDRRSRIWVGEDERADLEAHEHDLRAWVAAGCPWEDVEAESPRVDKRASAVARNPGTASATPNQPSRKLPDDLMKLSHQDRLYELAVEGLPSPGSLNPSLLVLARHLLQHEGVEDDIARVVLEHFCETKHNGMSKRLGDGFIDERAHGQIELALSQPISEVGVHRYKHPLRLRHLITGEGPENQYVPPSLLPQQPPHPAILSSVPHSGRLEVEPSRILPDSMIREIRQQAGRKPCKAIEFLTKFVSFLHDHGNESMVSRQRYMEEFLGYRSTSKWERYVEVGTKSGLIMKTKDNIRTVRSNHYALTEKAVALLGVLPSPEPSHPLVHQRAT
jgi:hypothetical protein